MRPRLKAVQLRFWRGGIDRPYPEENQALAHRIAQEGLCLSEQPIGMAPAAGHFPLRNRLISGLSRAVVVVEAASRSGSLITARAALDQGREVMAVPGHPFDGRASGCNQLLREGALLVRGPEDVLAALGEGGAARAHANPIEQPPPCPPLRRASPPSSPPSSHTASPPAPPKTPPPADLGAEILSRLSLSPIAEELLIRELQISPQALAPMVLALEIEGRITRHHGGLLSRSA